MHLAPPAHRIDPVTPICPYFGVCGGCDCQDVSYAAQCEAKEQHIYTLFSGLDITERAPIIHDERDYPIYFRNKIRFAFIEENGVIKPSRHRRGLDEADIVAEQCYLQSPEADQIINTIADIATREHWRIYDVKKRSGWLKHILIRQGKHTGDCMLVLITDASAVPDQQRITDEILERLPFITSLYQSQSQGQRLDHFTDVLLAGNATISEKIGESVFIISPHAFFQTNSAMVEKLYSTIGQHVGNVDSLWDLYAGSATIGIFLRNHAKHIHCFESNPANVDDAGQNITLNKAENVTMHSGSVEERLTSSFIREHGIPDCIIVDPPRAGLSAQTRTILQGIRPEKLVYVSCNPMTAVRDCGDFARNGWNISTLQPVDMFPHTWHCELIATLTPAD